MIQETMAGHLERFIWFCQTEYVAEHPDSLKKLRDEIGLTTIMPESHICHTSGFRAAEEIARRGPFEDWRQRTDQYPRAREGIYPPVAGTIGGFDDTALLRVIEACRRAGIEIWGHIGLWSYGGEVYPEYAMRDIEGRLLDLRYKQWGIGLCPGRKDINEWIRDCLVDLIRRYDLDGFDVDHARYPAPANLHSLLACGCSFCQEEAGHLGFDFERMKEGVLRLRAGLSALTREQVLRLGRARPGFWEFLACLGEDGAVLEWLRFRALVMAERMREFRAAVRGAGGADKVFGSDVFPPSIALLGGHIYGAWERGADYLTGGSSHGGVVGWATTVTNLASEWAPALCRAVADLQEGEALQLVYRMFGYDDLDLPLEVAGLRDGPLPLALMFAREVSRLKAQIRGRVPLYVPVSVGAEPELVRRLLETVTDNHCEGALFSGLDPENDETLALIRTVFSQA